MKSLFSFSSILVTSALLFSGAVDAQDTTLTDQICGKMKSCTIDQVPPEMVETMEQAFDGICANMIEKQFEKINNTGLESEATACVNSIVESNCETIMAAQGDFSTPECDDFSVKAEAAGIDTGKE